MWPFKKKHKISYNEIRGKLILDSKHFSIFLKGDRARLELKVMQEELPAQIFAIQLNTEKTDIRGLIDNYKRMGYEIIHLPGDVAGHFAYPII